MHQRSQIYSKKHLVILIYIGENIQRPCFVPISNIISTDIYYNSIYNSNINDSKAEDYKDHSTDWKIFLKLGFEIKNTWKNIIFSSNDQNEEILLVRNEVYNTLRGGIVY